MKKMFGSLNKFSLIIGILLFLIIAVFIYYIGVNDSPNLVPSVILSHEEVNVSISNKVSLLAYVDNVSNYTLTWISSDPNVASVNEFGTVVALNEGTAMITVSYIHSDGNVYTDNCLIKVSGGKDIKVTDITFPGEELVISENSETKIEPVILPTDVTINSIKYSSNNPNVAMINNDGVVNTFKKGNALIEIIVNDKYVDYLMINVVDKLSVNEYITVPTAIIFDDNKLALKEGDTNNLTYKVSPNEASSKYLEWQSSNDSVASVSSGVLKAIKEGQAIITVSYRGQVFDNIIINVSKKTISVTDVSLTATSTELNVNGTLQLDYKVYPTDATNPIVVFKSSDESIATVSNTGLVTGKKSGNVTITITTLDGNHTRSISLTVKTDMNRICDFSSKPNSGGDASCGKRVQSLYLTYNGSGLSHGDLITIKVGETITINVNLPTSCGSPMMLTRTSASGQDDWTTYLSGYSSPNVRMGDCSTAVYASSYKWVLTGKKVTSSPIIVSQTAEMSTTYYNYLKAMGELKIKVVN